MQVPSHNRLASSLGASTSGRPISASDCSRPLSFRRPTALSHSGWETLHSLQQSPVQQQQSSRQRLSRGTTHSHCRQQQVRLLCSAAQHSNGTSSKGPVIVIDNYDSFTYNLCQYLGDLGCDHIVYKNDEKSVQELREMNPRGILLSPGPGRPEDSGIALQTVQELGSEFPIFGVCMGHQCIGQVFGGSIIKAPSGVMHGKTSPVHHTNQGLMKGLSNPFLAARYHSLVIAKDSVPDVLEVTAWTEDGTIMAVQHKQHPQIQGVQFHPESIITDNGRQVVKNFIDSLC